MALTGVAGMANPLGGFAMRAVRLMFVIAAFLTLLPAAAYAQVGQIAGTVRDASDAVIPGVIVEVTSPALIEKVRSTTTDGSGQYQITNLPVGVYTVTFTLDGFSTLERGGVELTTGFTSNITVVMMIGQRNETIVVTAPTPAVDVQNARQATVFSGEQLRELPTARNISSILALTPGISSNANQFGGFSGVCSGGAGVFCSPMISSFNSHASFLD